MYAEHYTNNMRNSTRRCKINACILTFLHHKIDTIETKQHHSHTHLHNSPHPPPQIMTLLT